MGSSEFSLKTCHSVRRGRKVGAIRKIQKEVRFWNISYDMIWMQQQQLVAAIASGMSMIEEK